MNAVSDAGTPAVALPAVLDLAAAPELHGSLLSALHADAGPVVIIDGAATDRVATACIQVLIAADMAFSAAGCRLKIRNPSDALAASFRSLGLGAQFDKLCSD